MTITLFRSEEVEISSTMAMFENISLPIYNIGIVKVEEDKYGGFLIFFGVLLIIMCALIGLPLIGEGVWDREVERQIFFILIPALGGISAIVYGLERSQRLYLVIKASSGDKKIFSSKDHAKVREIGQAIRAAVNHRA